MLWWYALALTLSGLALTAVCFIFPTWDSAWSAVYVAEMLVFISIPIWIVVFIRWLLGK